MVQMLSNNGYIKQMLVHAIGGCRTPLLELRYNWRPGSVLLNIYNNEISARVLSF